MGLPMGEAIFIREHWNKYKLGRQKATQNWKLGGCLGEGGNLSHFTFLLSNRVISCEVQEKERKTCKSDPELFKSDDWNLYA